MLKYLKNEANMAYTENGAVTYASTNSECLDLFGTIGALRHADDAEIIIRFIRAFTENPDIAMKLLFFARDIRGGLGERKVFRVIMKWLAENRPQAVKKNIEYIAEYGRYDDLLSLFGTPCQQDALDFIKAQLTADIKALGNGGQVSLLAKWLPSVNASNADTVKNAKIIARAMGMQDSLYRKTLAHLRSHIHIIENNLRQKDYSFDYEKQPSKALLKYRKAFMRNDEDRYTEFLSNVEQGTAKLNAANVMPYELVQPFLREGGWFDADYGFMKEMSEQEKASLNATWNSLPDFGGDENALAVIDTSGSMYFQSKPLPAAVALSLGLYFAQRNKGAFANHFIEFSGRPQLIEIKGETFADKLRYVTSFNEVANTNLEAVFDLVLNTAVKNKVTQQELPAKIIIISDMEFDGCMDGASITNFENAKAKFARYGYKLPQVVFWNVASRNRQQPVRMNEQGVALVSGANPRIFSMVAGGIVSPYTMMMEVLESERYAKIAA
ncbi:MAG: DUF2828 family protein [Oscillospiraceae bacterium]|nr:DUF2828 family protein [Oscillospiraceae bacterium]